MDDFFTKKKMYQNFTEKIVENGYHRKYENIKFHLLNSMDEFYKLQYFLLFLMQDDRI